MPLPNQNPSGLIEEPINEPGASSGGSSTAAPSNASGLIEEPISGASASTAGSASDPSQQHWYDPITKAWNWATTPFGVVDRATDSDEVARQKIQHIGDEEALHAS